MAEPSFDSFPAARRGRGISDLERFWRYVDIGLPPQHRRELGPCWLWTGTVNEDGYGFMGITVALHRYRMPRVHRLSYRFYVGEIPPGLMLDHLCRVRRCVNPEHLEPVTPLVNTVRRRMPPLATRCKRGHEFTEANTRQRVNSRGFAIRACRECERAYDRTRVELTA